MSRARQSAGVVVVRETPGGPRLLLLRAYRNWDFPKGLVEIGEDPLAAAVRETAEETGIDDLSFEWGIDYCETAPYSRGKIARYYLARTRQADVRLGVNPALGRPEHHEWRWVDPTEARELAPLRIQPILRWVLEKLTR